jgi:hypothetical protein
MTGRIGGDFAPRISQSSRHRPLCRSPQSDKIASILRRGDIKVITRTPPIEAIERLEANGTRDCACYHVVSVKLHLVYQFPHTRGLVSDETDFT